LPDLPIIVFLIAIGRNYAEFPTKAIRLRFQREIVGF
jgi:hypothetical protein